MYQIHSGKFARLNLTPRQISCAITQFPEKYILHQADQPYLLKVTIFNKIKIRKELKIQKDINLQKMQSIFSGES